MAKGTITLSGSTVGTKMESLEVEQGATGGVAGLFKVDNNDTDKVAMSIEAANIDADVLDVSMDAVTTAKGIDITADGLTTGSALYIDSDSSSTSTRSIASVIQNHASATGSTALTLQSDAGRGLFIDANLAAGGPSIEIDANQTTTNAISINSDPATTGTVIDMSADGLTTGGALKIDSDSSSTSARNIVEIINNNTAATGATALKVQQDSSGDAAVFQGGNIRVTKGGSAYQTSLHHSWVMGG